MDQLEEVERKLKEIGEKLDDLTLKLVYTQTPFNPPLTSHLKRIEEIPFEKLSFDLQNLARYLKLNEEEDELLKERERTNDKN